MVKAVLREHAKHLPIVMPIPQQVTNIKQYKLPGGHKEIGETLQELKKVGIIKPTHSPFNSPVWPVKKSNGSRELNKVTPLCMLLSPL